MENYLMWEGKKYKLLPVEETKTKTDIVVEDDNSKAIAEDYEKGLGYRQLKRKYRITEANIKKALDKHGVERRTNKLDDDMVRAILDMYGKGMNMLEISQVLDLAVSTVWKYVTNVPKTPELPTPKKKSLLDYIEGE